MGEHVDTIVEVEIPAHVRWHAFKANSRTLTTGVWICTILCLAAVALAVSTLGSRPIQDLQPTAGNWAVFLLTVYFTVMITARRLAKLRLKPSDRRTAGSAFFRATADEYTLTTESTIFRCPVEAISSTTQTRRFLNLHVDESMTFSLPLKLLSPEQRQRLADSARVPQWGRSVRVNPKPS
ncbi:hypothetical protein [Fodinicola feengrottensis]|uniref:hypothetical protein n=1 Tax=Fodinicola feengrottensis TaxID=435914 RepID=UPI0013D3071F|nr:hypothetical protein [Fodinicola feengrottensis]